MKRVSEVEKREWGVIAMKFKLMKVSAIVRACIVSFLLFGIWDRFADASSKTLKKGGNTSYARRSCKRLKLPPSVMPCHQLLSEGKRLPKRGFSNSLPIPASVSRCSSAKQRNRSDGFPVCSSETGSIAIDEVLPEKCVEDDGKWLEEFTQSLICEAELCIVSNDETERLDLITSLLNTAGIRYELIIFSHDTTVFVPAGDFERANVIILNVR